jgi:hydroxyethylthiazole kinase
MLRSPEISADAIWSDLQKIRATKPLVHNITNTVVQEFTANALLALGASPIMSDAVEEISELVQIANAVNINIGTPRPDSIPAMVEAIKAARNLRKPIALDPVAVGATKLRRNLAQTLLDAAMPTVIRGNLAEVSTLGGMKWQGKGVDAGQNLFDPVEVVQRTAQQLGCVVVGTGEIDYASDGDQVIAIANGHLLLTRVTGTGCVATALIAAFLAIQSNPLIAAVHAMTLIGVTAEIAAEHSRTDGPASFQMRFIDSFDKLSLQHLENRMRVTERR